MQTTEMWPGVWPGSSTATMRPSSLSARLRGERAERPAVERERLGREARRQRLAEHAAHDAREGLLTNASSPS